MFVVVVVDNEERERQLAVHLGVTLSVLISAFDYRLQTPAHSAVSRSDVKRIICALCNHKFMMDLIAYLLSDKHAS